MKLKEKLKKYEEGSVFELKIDSEKYPEYNDKYIYLIKSSYIYKHEKNKLYFYALITEKKKIEDLLTINEEEIVKMNIFTYETRFLPLDDSKDLSYRKKVKFYPDKYNYLWINIFKILKIDEAYNDKLNYIGKIDFKRPEKEYIPFSEKFIYGYYGDFDLELDDYIIYYYENYNRKKSPVFTQDGNKDAHYSSMIILYPIFEEYKEAFNLDDKFNVKD